MLLQHSAALTVSQCQGWREFLQLLPEQGEILPDILGHIIAIKRRRWVITREVFAVVVFDHTPSYLLHAINA